MVKFDELGPKRLIEIYDHKLKLHGYLVIDNTTLGPAKGGLRITPMVNIGEVAALARVMTYKCALAELPFGGGKSGIKADLKRISKEEKFALIRSFSKAIKPLCPKEYIAGPDVGTGETEIAEFVRANGSLKAATGKPANMCVKPGVKCGIPHEFGSTGFGVAQAAIVAADFAKLRINKVKVAIAGFGNVGTFAASFLASLGAKIIAVSDSTGTIYNPGGIDIKKVTQVKKETNSVTKYQLAEVLPKNKIFELQTDILIPAALNNVITTKNVNRVQAKIIVEGANLPLNQDAEDVLNQKEILVVPDFVANAGGVISSYAEYRGYNPKQMFEIVKRRIIKNTKLVLKKASKEQITPREAALKIAIERIQSVN